MENKRCYDLKFLKTGFLLSLIGGLFAIIFYIIAFPNIFFSPDFYMLCSSIILVISIILIYINYLNDLKKQQQLVS